MTIRSYSGPLRKRTPASAYKLPLGPVVESCYGCGHDVYESELTFCWADGAIRWVHRSCRVRVLGEDR